jgi:hypothetical protein
VIDEVNGDAFDLRGHFLVRRITRHVELRIEHLSGSTRGGAAIQGTQVPEIYLLPVRSRYHKRTTPAPKTDLTRTAMGEYG